MAADDLASAVQQLRIPGSELAATTYLKNEIIGHPERKRALVRAGVAEALSHVLSLHPHIKGKRTTRNTNGSTPVARQALHSPEDQIHLQALQLLNSLLLEGLPFLAPFQACDINPTLLASINVSDFSPSIVLASLKALVSIAKATRELHSRLQFDPQPVDPIFVYSKTDIESFAAILAQRAHSATIRHQVVTLCQLVKRTVRHDNQRSLLVSCGIIDHLAAYLAAYHTRNRPSPARNTKILLQELPSPPSTEGLAHILGALTSITGGSGYRVACLLLSPSALTFFPFHQSKVMWDQKLHQPSQCALYEISPAEFSLPWVHAGIQKVETGFHKAFPALGTMQIDSRNATLVDFADPSGAKTPDKAASSGAESGLISWLVHIMRTTKSTCRIRAAELLASIGKARYMKRERTLGALLVPLLVELLDNPAIILSSSTHDPLKDPQSRGVSSACGVLAALLEENPSLQRAAVDAGILKKVCSLLKQTFGTIENMPAPWTVLSSDNIEQDATAATTLGPPAIPPNVLYLFRCRESLLHIAGALSVREDNFRKILVDNGLVPAIIDSLVPLNDKVLEKLQRSGRKTSLKLDASFGNPRRVIIAACKTATTLTRSVSLLRTSLIDAGLAKPIFDLVKHSDVDVLVSATTVTTNLLTEFSPMRQTLIDCGVIKILCQHAHSADSRIRAISLFALKNLVYQAPNEVKVSLFDELGLGWLVQIIGGSSSGAMDTSQTTPSKTRTQPSHLSISGANAQGQRVDILNATEDEPMQDGSSSQPSPVNSTFTPAASTFESNEHLAGADTVDGGGSGAGAQTPPPTAHLREIKAQEDAYKAGQPGRDEIQIQTHALDILRNATTGPGSPDIIDSLFTTLGSNRVYEIITSKLAPLATAPAPSMSAIQNYTIFTFPARNYQPRAVLVSAVYTVCHIAGSHPRHRQQLISQQHLLSSLLPLFNYPDQDVRSGCLWVILNLAWVDDQSDAAGARQRACELRAMGFETLVEKARRDQAQDVRER